MAVRLHTKLGLIPDEERLEASPDAVVVHEPTIGATSRSKGSLFAVIAASAGGAKTREATQYLADEIERSYYYDESAGIPICLEKALQGANRRLVHRREAHGLQPGSVGIAVAVVRERELYVATAGEVDAFLARAGGLLTLPEEERGPGVPTTDDLRVDVWRGELLVGDVLVLASREFARRLGPEEIRRSVTTLHPGSAAQHLHHELLAEGATGSDAILVIEATEIPATRTDRTLVPVKAAEPLAGAPDSSPIPLADSVAAGASAVQGRARTAGAAGAAAVTGLVDRLLDVLPHRAAPYRRVTPLADRRGSQRRLGIVALGALGVVLVLGLVLWVSGGAFGGRQQGIQQVNAGEDALAAARQQLDLVFGGGADLVAGDPQKALVDLREAWRQLGLAQQAGISAGRLAPLRDQAAGGLDRLYGVVNTGSAVLVPPKKISATPDLTELVSGPDGALYSIDRSAHTVVRFDSSKRSAQVVVKMGDGTGNGVGDPWMLAVGGPDVLILDHNGAMWRWRPADKTGHGTLASVHIGGSVTWGTDILDIGTYLRNADAGLYNLYVIDPSSRQILRYTPAADGSGFPSDPTNYLATASDVSGYQQMFIDGDIYTLTHDSVIRLSNGRPDQWTPGALPDQADLRAGHDYRQMTASAARRDGRIYVYDAAHARVIAYDKRTGDFIEQYIAAEGTPPFTDVRGMVVVERTNGRPNSLLWVGPDRLYLTVLQPLPAAGASPAPTPGPSPSASHTARPTRSPAHTARPAASPSASP